MAQLIEFIGPPGTGKSAVYAALCKEHHARGCRWLPYHQLVDYEIRRLIQSYPWSNRLRSKIKSLVKRDAHRQFMTTQLRERYANAFAEGRREYMDRLWCQIACRRDRFTGFDTRWEAMSYIRGLTAATQLAEQSDAAQYCVIEEALVQNLGFATDKNPDTTTTNDLQQLIGQLNINGAFVHFLIDEKTLFSRVKGRRKIASIHRYASESQIQTLCSESIQAIQKRADVLRARGSDLLELDATETIHTNAQKIANWLQNDCSQ